MVLGTVIGSENVPKNSVILSRKEALQHQVNLVYNWRNGSEVFFLKYGQSIISFATGFSSFFILRHMRRSFKLGKTGRITTFFPGVIIPSFVSFMTYDKFITNEILLMKISCPLCMQLKYCALHICNTVLYSTALSGVVCSGIATFRQMCFVPHIGYEPKLYFQHMFKVIKPAFPIYQMIAACHFILILALPYLQSQQFSNLMEKLEEMENSYEKELSHI